MWTIIAKLSNVQKSDLSDKIKKELFQAVAVSALMYSCTTWALMKHLEKKQDENYTILELTPHKTAAIQSVISISETIWVRWARHTGQ